MRNLLSNCFKVCLFVFVILGSTKTFAQIDLSSCYGSCTSGDFTIVRAYLSDANGVAIQQSACDNPNNTVTAYLSFVFSNNTNSARNGIFISGTVTGATVTPSSPAGYIFRCFSGLLPKKSLTTFTDVNHTISWHCGLTLGLSNTFIAWGAAGEDVCTNTCAQATPSKCRTVGGVTIETPLSNNFTFSNACTTGNQFETVTFDGSHAGGSGTITFDWNFGDGTTHATIEDPTHTYTSAGAKTVIFKVTDAVGTTKTVSQTVTVAACCTVPVVTDQPDDVAKCAGQSTSFTSTATGTPTPTVQWQVSTNGGSSYSNLSGETGTTLSLSNVTVSMSGNKYRAVFTSGVCTSTNSDPATLTVNANPTAGAGTTPSSQCFVPSPTGNTFALSGSGLNGTPSWAVQSNPNSLTVAITNGNTLSPSVKVTGSGAGSVTLRLSVSSASCGTATSDVTVTTLARPGVPTTQYHAPACTEATFSVTVGNVTSGAIYTIVDNDGHPIAGVSPASPHTAANSSDFDFTNIPAGSGFMVTASNSDGCNANSPVPCSGGGTVNRISNSTSEIIESQTTTVKAYPNPFSDRVKFLVTSAASGRGSLEVYNMMGQRVRTVYQGFITKGSQTFELSLPNQQVANLIYVLRVGDKKMSGKLLQINQ